jgi:hypothetical protein
MTSNAGAGPKPVAKPGKTSSTKFAEADAKYAGQLDKMTMKEKSLLGLPYIASDPKLIQDRTKTRRLLQQYNSSISGPASESEQGANDVSNEKRRGLMTELFGISAEAAKRIFIEPPFWW